VNPRDDLDNIGQDLLMTLMTTGEDLLMTHYDYTDNYCDDNFLLSHKNVLSHSLNKKIDLQCRVYDTTTRALRERTTSMLKTSWESLCSCKFKDFWGSYRDPIPELG
jgi:hypothetical protein